MKLAVVVDQFPVLSQTFVLNQITGLIDLGIHVSIISLNQPEQSQKIHPLVTQYNLLEKTTYLLAEPKTKISKAIYRLKNALRACTIPKKRKLLINSLSACYGVHGKSLLLASIAYNLPKPLIFDVVLCHFGYNGILANNLRNLGLLKGKIATIFHGHEVSAQQALLRYQKGYEALFNQTELMLPISQLWEQKLISLGCSHHKIHVHRMGVNLDSFHVKTVGNKKKPTLTLFTAARFSEKKGLEFAIKALALLPDEMKIRYILAGYGELEQYLKNLVNTLALTKKVEFVGALNQIEIAKYMRESDVFIQPSITAENGDMEGVPVAIMEAMASGIPVISTFHSGIPELITHGETGLLSPEKDELGLANNIKLLNEDIKLRDKLAYNARLRIEDIANVEKLNKILVKRLTALGFDC